MWARFLNAICHCLDSSQSLLGAILALWQSILSPVVIVILSKSKSDHITLLVKTQQATPHSTLWESRGSPKSPWYRPYPNLTAVTSLTSSPAMLVSRLLFEHIRHTPDTRKPFQELFLLPGLFFPRNPQESLASSRSPLKWDLLIRPSKDSSHPSLFLCLLLSLLQKFSSSSLLYNLHFYYTYY